MEEELEFSHAGFYSDIIVDPFYPFKCSSDIYFAILNLNVQKIDLE